MTFYGPLRHVSPDFYVWPWWSYMDHDALPYISRSDHRATTGEIVPLGTRCVASRSRCVITMVFPDGLEVTLDGKRWSLDGAPVLECPELLLCA